MFEVDETMVWRYLVNILDTLSNLRSLYAFFVTCTINKKNIQANTVMRQKRTDGINDIQVKDGQKTLFNREFHNMTRQY